MADENAEVTKDQPGVNIYSMSDEEIMNLDFNPSETPTAELPEEESEDEEVIEDSGAEENDQEDTQEEPEDDTPDESETAEQDEEIVEAPVQDVHEEDEIEQESANEGEEDDNQDDQDVIDYEVEYQKITSPFKANGRQMQVANAEEAITLMQMGANYNKKMASLKPHLKTVKILENNGIDEDTLNYLIDLNRKEPEAINKLIKDSGLDPMEMDVEKESNYQPTQYNISDQEFELYQAVEDIKDTDTYSRTIDVLGNKWDSASKEEIGKQPGIINIINQHMADGIYDVISTELERRKALGQLQGLNDLVAYQQVGESIQAVGGFDHLYTQQNEQVQAKQAPKPKRLPPKQKVEDPKLKAKRKAASSAKASPSQKTTPTDFNPLSMSDEEFAKQFSQQLL